MIIIYTQNFTAIKQNAEDAKELLLSIYGEKFGVEAYEMSKKGIIGSSYRKHGGPLVRVVTKQEADRINQKESQIGMLMSDTR